MLTYLLDLIAPARCLACGRPDDPVWCPPCSDRAGRFQHLAPEAMPVLTAPPSPDAAAAGTVAMYQYTQIVADAIVRAKVGGAGAAWQQFGLRLASHIGPAVWDGSGIDGIVAVPTEPGRVRRRGFDHTALLATGVAAGLGRPVLPAVLRVAPGTPDRGQGSHLPVVDLPRMHAIRPLTGARVLLVDDLVTTGATVAAATRALLRAGVSTTTVAVVAGASRIPPA